MALGSTVIVAVPLYFLAAQLLEQSLEERLEGTAELAALELTHEHSRLFAAGGAAPDGLQERLATLCEEADLDAMYLVALDGTIRLAAGTPGVRLTEADRAALTATVGADSSNTPVQLDEAGLRFLTAYAPTSDATIILGVRASAPYMERLDALRSLFGLAALAWGAAVAVLGAGVAARLTRPIRRLLDATDRLAAGSEPDPPAPGGSAELDSLQEAFSEMAGAVRQRERHLRSLAGAVAHEVRNPSNALRLHLGLLRRDYTTGSAERFVDRMGVLERELDLLDATVDGFLVFAHDRAARREPVALRALLERAAGGAVVEAPDLDVVVDPLLIGRAVANLVRNAREAGGEPVVVRAEVREGSLYVEVEDHGRGFAPAVIAHAFEPFVSGRVGGSGLGLAIVAAVATAHGGQATVMRSGAGGTVVVLRLPRVSP